jgi:1-acyl-sn-glycerol-3-phosphate acyltransferase
MAEDYFRSSRSASVPGVYRLLRSLVRLGILFFRGKMRVLAEEHLAVSAPAVLVVAHPADFAAALYLIAGTNRQIRCLMDRKLIAGTLQRFLARGLGMIPFEKEGDAWRRAIEKASNVLGNLGAVAVFAELREFQNGESARFASTAATIALEAESRNANQLDVQTLPVHVFLPEGSLRSSERLVHFGIRIAARTYMMPGKTMNERHQGLSAALEEACRKNVFRLQPEDVGNFLADLEEVLLADLREDFSARTRWKQKVEDFHLSGFVTQCVEHLNFLHPFRLVVLRQLHGAYREALRRASLEKLEIESAGPWIQSALRRGLGWIETLAGFPLASYGLLNHLPIGIFLWAAGLLKKQGGIQRTALWISRSALMLVFYAAQVLATDHFLGRVAAGYYALSLPLSALYLWRYAWLLEHRSRLLLLHSRASRRSARAREKRRELVRELNAARDAYVESLELVH